MSRLSFPRDATVFARSLRRSNPRRGDRDCHGPQRALAMTMGGGARCPASRCPASLLPDFLSGGALLPIRPACQALPDALAGARDYVMPDSIRHPAGRRPRNVMPDLIRHPDA